MKLVFYKASKGAIGDKLIAWWTAPFKYKFNGMWKDMFSHVEIVFSDGQMFSASQYENKVRFTPHSFTGHAWFRVKITVPVRMEVAMRNRAMELVGAKYDYTGVAGFALPFIRENKNKWFCSEVVRDVLMVGRSDLLNSSLCNSEVSPTSLAFEIGLVYNEETNLWEHNNNGEKL